LFNDTVALPSAFELALIVPLHVPFVIVNVLVGALLPLYVNVPLVGVIDRLHVPFATLALNVALADLCVDVAATFAVIVTLLLVALTGVNVLPLTVTYAVSPLLKLTVLPHALVAVIVLVSGYVNATTLLDVKLVLPSFSGFIAHVAFSVVNAYVALLAA
jgi:hypothetical protein